MTEVKLFGEWLISQDELSDSTDSKFMAELLSCITLFTVDYRLGNVLVDGSIDSDCVCVNVISKAIVRFYVYVRPTKTYQTLALSRSNLDVMLSKMKELGS